MLWALINAWVIMPTRKEAMDYMQMCRTNRRNCPEMISRDDGNKVYLSTHLPYVLWLCRQSVGWLVVDVMIVGRAWRWVIAMAMIGDGSPQRRC